MTPRDLKDAIYKHAAEQYLETLKECYLNKMVQFTFLDIKDAHTWKQTKAFITNITVQYGEITFTDVDGNSYIVHNEEPVCSIVG